MDRGVGAGGMSKSINLELPGVEGPRDGVYDVVRICDGRDELLDGGPILEPFPMFSNSSVKSSKWEFDNVLLSLASLLLALGVDRL